MGEKRSWITLLEHNGETWVVCSPSNYDEDFEFEGDNAEQEATRLKDLLNQLESEIAELKATDTKAEYRIRVKETDRGWRDIDESFPSEDKAVSYAANRNIASWCEEAIILRDGITILEGFSVSGDFLSITTMNWKKVGQNKWEQFQNGSEDE